MEFPDDKEIARVKKQLAGVDPVKILPRNASQVDKLKFELCKQFVVYLREQGMAQVDLADQLGIEPARLNEMVKYRIELFTVDRLLGYAEKLNPKIRVTVA
jgi:predicted XRE-type DNA-binding protein